MTANAFLSPAYSRLDSSLTNRGPRTAAKATRAQSAVELTLFAVFGLSIVLTAIALFAMYSPEHQLVPNRVADGMKAGRVNILIIGTSKDGRSVSTQSLTLLSVRPQSSQAAMISLPRDLWVHVGHHGSHRLAAAMNIGESSGYPGEGPGLVSDTVENVIGQPVHAYIRVDAADLRTTVDALGGIDVVVPHAFYERSKKDQFRAGLVHLNGERAVRYAQSEAVRGPQGARFARELRQQQVIAQVVRKLTQAPPQVRARLAASGLIGRSSSTNLTAQQVDQLCAQVASAAVRNVTIEPLVTEFEVRSLFDAGAAVRPRTGDYSKVQELARNVFAGAQPIAAFH
jgi:LCP family protein required for cell wall assembly